MFSLTGLVFLITTATGWASFPPSLSGVDVVTGAQVVKQISEPKHGTVIVFLSARCPCSSGHEGSLKKLSEEFSPRGFQFLAVHSNRDESLQSAGTHFRISALPFPVIQDEENRIANTFNALKTPHVFILNKKGELLYQGGVDDSRVVEAAEKFYLKEALAALSEGKEVPVKETRSLGCVIQR